MNICKWLGHKWKPVFFCGIIRITPVKFIGCYCLRCRKGYKEFIDLQKAFTQVEYATYSEKFFNQPVV
jgi:hypothetical protein